ncbi:MAG: hypothetical protein WBN56_15065 [Robiginitalea sp.]|uniref:hypothetical protein n=1 Tax=Robiginitalea sp. TaxID=1902411 RepID=UPI003C792E2B
MTDLAREQTSTREFKEARMNFQSALALVAHIYQMGERSIIEDEIHSIVCNGGMHPVYELTLEKIHGYGNNIGVEEEMKARYKVHRGKE